MTKHPETIRWSADGRAIDIIDQTQLPLVEQRIELRNAEEVAHAIRVMQIRGAPAIGVVAAMGLALELANHTALSAADFRERLDATARLLAASRPTAVNLFWAIERMQACARAHAERTPGEIACKLYGEANAILAEDQAMCRAIGENGAMLLEGCASVLTHCNAGALATAGMGTALAPLYVLHERGAAPRVISSETRPALQGARLTSWELNRAGIAVTLVTDSTVASLMRAGRIDAVIVGADRIAANGDTANKIGTYAHAVLARQHGIPFYVAAPSSTIDPFTADGEGIPIEERSPEEVRTVGGQRIAPDQVAAYAPAFDVTPHEFITAIITDRGVLRPPFQSSIAASIARAAEIPA